MPEAGYLVVCGVALAASALTLFSGFGLGTLLLPAFAVFFPVEIAVAATAIVHLLNNLFKLGLVGRHANRRMVLRFGIPAALTALAGAWLLSGLAGLPVIVEYRIGDHLAQVSAVKLVVATSIGVFAIFDLLPSSGRLAFDQRFVPVGGAISGFFGGISGHQGALRSAFLIRAGLGKQEFVGTGVVCAVLVDVSRLVVYGAALLETRVTAVETGDGLPVVIAASLSAFAGAFIGVRILGKITLPTLHRIVGVLLLAVALLMGSGLV